jgi:hypothetical protein
MGRPVQLLRGEPRFDTVSRIEPIGNSASAALDVGTKLQIIEASQCAIDAGGGGLRVARSKRRTPSSGCPNFSRPMTQLLALSTDIFALATIVRILDPLRRYEARKCQMDFGIRQITIINW